MKAKEEEQNELVNKQQQENDLLKLKTDELMRELAKAKEKLEQSNAKFTKQSERIN